MDEIKTTSFYLGVVKIGHGWKVNKILGREFASKDEKRFSFVNAYRKYFLSRVIKFIFIF